MDVILKEGFRCSAVSQDGDKIKFPTPLFSTANWIYMDQALRLLLPSRIWMGSRLMELVVVGRSSACVVAIVSPCKTAEMLFRTVVILSRNLRVHNLLILINTDGNKNGRLEGHE